MATWTPESQGADEWTTQYSVLYLLTESGENLLDETGDLIVLNRGGIGVWTGESQPSDTWSEESPPNDDWTEESGPTNTWT